MRIFAVALLASTAAFAQPHWPQFRGPSASGLGSGEPALQWDGKSGENILWKLAIPGLGHSSPVIWGNRIFVTAAVPGKGEGPLKLGLYGDIKSVDNEGHKRSKCIALTARTGRFCGVRRHSTVSEI
jgi:hypothetical protein